jgi:hypothetical protein
LNANGERVSVATAVSPDVDADKAITDRTFSSHVLMSERATACVVKEAVQEAWKQLEMPRCQRLLTEFSDQRGRPLADNIAKDDGSDTRSCAQGRTGSDRTWC